MKSKDNNNGSSKRHILTIAFQHAVEDKIVTYIKTFHMKVKHPDINRYIFTNRYCEINIFLYFGHDTNIVAYFSPVGKTSSIFKQPVLGLTHLLNKQSKDQWICKTETDVRKNIIIISNILRNKSMKLINGDEAIWKYWNDEIKKRVDDGVKEWIEKMDRLKKRYEEKIINK